MLAIVLTAEYCWIFCALMQCVCMP
jgi:hypothetical protein